MAIILHFNIHYLVRKLLYFVQIYLFVPLNEHDHAPNTQQAPQTAMALIADTYIRHCP